MENLKNQDFPTTGGNELLITGKYFGEEAYFTAFVGTQPAAIKAGSFKKRGGVLGEETYEVKIIIPEGEGKHLWTF